MSNKETKEELTDSTVCLDKELDKELNVSTLYKSPWENNVLSLLEQKKWNTFIKELETGFQNGNSLAVDMLIKTVDDCLIKLERFHSNIGDILVRHIKKKNNPLKKNINVVTATGVGLTLFSAFGEKTITRVVMAGVGLLAIYMGVHYLKDKPVTKRKYDIIYYKLRSLCRTLEAMLKKVKHSLEAKDIEIYNLAFYHQNKYLPPGKLSFGILYDFFNTSELFSLPIQDDFEDVWDGERLLGNLYYKPFVHGYIIANSKGA